MSAASALGTRGGGFMACGDSALCQDILNISMAAVEVEVEVEVEAIVEPESLPHEVLWVQHRK